MVSDNPETFADLDGHSLEAPSNDNFILWAQQNLKDDHIVKAQDQNSGTAKNQTDADKKKPQKVIRTGKRVYTKPTKINGVKFEGTAYSYKVVDANNNIVRGPMTVTENLTATSETKDMPQAGTWSTNNGQFTDYVGYAATSSGFPANYSNVVDQSFTATQNGVSTQLNRGSSRRCRQIRAEIYPGRLTLSSPREIRL